MLYCKHECGFLILRNQKGCAMMNKFDLMGKDAISKMEDLMNASRLNELLHKKEEEEKKKNCILWVLAIFGAVAAVAAIAYGVYRFFTPDYLEDFEDDFDDDFDDDFFEDEDEEMPVRKTEAKEEKPAE
jgi:hypothetical protein